MLDTPIEDEEQETTKGVFKLENTPSPPLPDYPLVKIGGLPRWKPKIHLQRSYGTGNTHTGTTRTEEGSGTPNLPTR